MSAFLIIFGLLILVYFLRHGYWAASADVSLPPSPGGARLLAIFAAIAASMALILALTGCSTEPTYSTGHQKDGAPVYSAKGFMVGSQMYYWRPWFEKDWWGKDPIDHPLSSVYVVQDDAGHLYVSPKLAKKLDMSRFP